VNQCTYETHSYDAEDDVIRSKDENCVNCHPRDNDKEESKQLPRKRKHDRGRNPRHQKASRNWRCAPDRYGLR
jgi:hypothetical protein